MSKTRKHRKTPNTSKPPHTNSALNAAARTLTFVFAPPLVQYAMLLYVYRGADEALLAGLGLMFIFLIPLLGYILYVRYGVGQKDMYILERKHRTVPFTIGVASSVIQVACYRWLDLDDPHELIFEVTLLLLAVTLLAWAITLFWRISLHMTSMGGTAAWLLATEAWQPTPLAIAAVLCTVAVAWARYYLRGHTVPQIIGGTVFGGGSIVVYLYSYTEVLPYILGK